MRMKRWISLLLSFCMLFSVPKWGTLVMAEELDGQKEMKEETPGKDPKTALYSDETFEYELYPTPHSVYYEASSITLPANMNVFYEPGIDQYTVARAKQAMGKAGISLTEQAVFNNYNVAEDSGTLVMQAPEEPKRITNNYTIQNQLDALEPIGAKKEMNPIEEKAGAATLLVGIYGSGEAADTYFQANHSGDATSDFFLKTDSYLLSVKDQTIAVLGKDTDAAFYGLTTLKQIMQQTSGRTVNQLLVKDWADVASRGFIEGYYGNPWSNEDRSELMKFGGEIKLNSYFYAPKDDPKHAAQWWVLYTPEELEGIKMLAQAGEESKCRYVYALHPFWNNGFSLDGFNQANYDEKLALLKAKFEQVMDAGVRQIAILADDRSQPDPGTGTTYLKLMNDLTAWVRSEEMQTKYPGLKDIIPFCPNEYMGWGEGYMANFPDNVPIVVTGGAIWGEVYDNFTNSFYNATSRGPYMWVNWPCSDNSKNHLIMGGYDAILHKGVDPEKLQGIILNPMQQSEASKVAIFGNAEYSWNIWETQEEVDRAWDASFKYIETQSHVDTAASAALRELSKHMITHNRALPESVVLGPKLAEFRRKLTAGEPITADADALIAEFKKLDQAADTYRTSGHKPMADQISYWLDCWNDTCDAAIDLLEALKLIEAGVNENSTEIVELYSAAQTAWDTSKTHSFWYIDHNEYAEVGVQHIVPFVNGILGSVADVALPLIDPTKINITPITNRTDAPNGPLTNILDGSLTTEAVFSNPNVISVGEYVGVKYSRPIAINKVRFELGTNSNPHDTFNEGKLEYTEDGKTWIEVPGSAFTGNPSVVEMDNLGLTASGIRVIATAERTNTWFGVREIIVNEPVKPDVPDGDLLTGTVIKSSHWAVAQGTSEASLTDGNDGTYVWYDSDAPGKPDTTIVGDYLGLDFGAVEHVGKVRFLNGGGDGDKWAAFHLEYSEDGASWTSLPGFTGAASGTDEYIVDLKGAAAQYIKLVNDQEVPKWIKFSELTVWKADPASVYPTGIIKTSGWAVYQGPESNLIDGKDDTYVWYDLTSSSDKSLVGDYIGVDLGEVIPIREVYFANGADNGDKWKKFHMEYSVDNTVWTSLPSFSGAASGMDHYKANLKGAEARYVRFINDEEVPVWVKFSEITVTKYIPGYGMAEHGLASTDELKELLSGELTDRTATVSGNGITLQPGEYVGMILPRIREVVSVTANHNGGSALTLMAGWHLNEMAAVTLPLGASVDARYVYLKNTSNAAVTFDLTELTAVSNEIVPPDLVGAENGVNAEGTNFGIDQWYGASDSRKTGTTKNLFDGDITTKVEFCDYPKAGSFITYDLGQTRTIKDLKVVCHDSEKNFLRDGKVQISMDNVNWTDVGEVGDGVQNMELQDKIYADGWMSLPNHPNFVYFGGSIAPTEARYVRILATAPYAHRFVSFNEMIINGGEYVPVENNPNYDYSPIEVQGFGPEKLFDNDITTGFRPNMEDVTEGYFTYRMTENNDISQINILQSGGVVSEAKVEVRTADGWETVGTLDKAFNILYLANWPVYEIRLSWSGVQPTFYEMVLVPQGIVAIDWSKLEKLVDEQPVITDESLYQTVDMANYKKALADAKALLAEKPANATQKAVNDALDGLNAAYAALLAGAEDLATAKEALKTLLASYMESSYTASSWKAFLESAAYQDAQAALEATDPAAVKAAVDALILEAKKLEQRADMSAVSAMLAQIAALDGSKYTQASYAALQAVVNEAKAALGSTDISQAQADALLARLGAAVEALEEKQESTGAKLSSLSVSGVSLSPAFSPDVMNYTASVSYDVASVIVSAAAENGGVLSGDLGEKALQVGDNQLRVVVTDESGNILTYTISISRAKPEDPNPDEPELAAKLVSLSVEGVTLTPAFDPDTTNYQASVSNKVSSVIIAAEAEEGVLVSGDLGKQDLKVGENEFVVIATGNDDTSLAYNILIVRAKKSSSGGGGGGSADTTIPGGNKNESPSDNTDKTEKPAVGKVEVSGQDKGTAALPDKAVEDAIRNAKKEAEKTNTGGEIMIETSLPQGTKDVIVSRETLEKLVAENVSNFQLNFGKEVIVNVDLSAKKQIAAETKGDLNVSAVRVESLSETATAVIGSRPVFDISIASGDTAVKQFKDGTVTISIPYALKTGENAKNICMVYVDSDGNVSYLEDSYYDTAQKAVVGKTNHLSIYGVAYREASAEAVENRADVPQFTDITTHWAKGDILFAAERGVLSGTGGNLFSPNMPMTRGMFVTALGRLAGINPADYTVNGFIDVQAGSYYAPYVNWAAEKGIVSGVSTKQFAPEKPISRQEMAVIMMNYAGAMRYRVPDAVGGTVFSDKSTFAEWSKDAVQSMQMAGVLMGKEENRFDPEATATRAEVAAVLHRFVQIIIDAE